MEWSKPAALMVTTASFAVVAHLVTRFPQLHRHPASPLLWILACLLAVAILQMCSRHGENHIFPTLTVLFLTARALVYGSLAWDLAVATANPCFKFRPTIRFWSHVGFWVIALVYASMANVFFGVRRRFVRILPSIVIVIFVGFHVATAWRRISRPYFQAHIATGRVIKITRRALIVFVLSSILTFMSCAVPTSPATTTCDQLTLATEALSVCLLFCHDANIHHLYARLDESYQLPSAWHSDKVEAERAALPIGPSKWLRDVRFTTIMALACAYEQPRSSDHPERRVHAAATAEECSETSDLVMVRHGEQASTVVKIVCFAPRVFEREQQRHSVSRATLRTMFRGALQHESLERVREVRAMSFPVWGDGGSYSVQYLPSPHAVETIVAMLPAYSSYVTVAPRTLLPQYIDLFSLSVPLCTRRLGVVLIRHGICRPRFVVQHSISGARGDGNVNGETREPISINPASANSLLHQLQDDCGFLAEQGFVGYRVEVAYKLPRDGPDEDDGGILSSNEHQPGKYQFRIVDIHHKYQPRTTLRCRACGRKKKPTTPTVYAERVLARVRLFLGTIFPTYPDDSFKPSESELTRSDVTDPPSSASTEATISIRGSSIYS